MSRLRSTLAQRAWRAAPVLSRVVAAIGGGYAVAALASLAVLALPVDAGQAVLAGQTASFALYAGAVIWVYAVRSAWRAWAGLLAVAGPLAVAAWWATSAGISS